MRDKLTFKIIYRILIYKFLDKIIQILRNVDNPKPKIIKIGKFSDDQYEAIINMKLRNINGTLLCLKR